MKAYALFMGLGLFIVDSGTLDCVVIKDSLDPNAKLSGVLHYVKTEKHPLYSNQEKDLAKKDLADGSCKFTITLKNYEVDEWVRCHNFKLHTVGKIGSDGNIISLKLFTVGTVYDMEGSVNFSTALEPRLGFWRADLMFGGGCVS